MTSIMWTGRPGRAADLLELDDPGDDLAARGDEPGPVARRSARCCSPQRRSAAFRAR
ncbi:hypothetical protein [Streptomyces sp. NPDC088135]|uniref:hypothetical protein n=1 Tax=Streptomyces sp. NPDC088135 TaxID=3160993 RepID=UPI0034211BBF